MVHECQHMYETGRKCRRIPKRGDDLCPGHRPHPNRSFHDESSFLDQLGSFRQQIGKLSLLDQFAALQEALIAARPILDRQLVRTNARAAYTPIARAIVAVTVVWDSLNEAQKQDETRAQLRAQTQAQNQAQNQVRPNHPEPIPCIDNKTK